mmetsp:Transcript_22900/g.46867  ORF Transcript_22900/g.46867 Transcript_22900/m.46867 type:complete len:226 (-) Transcript_22900:275-952(-)|eukprot:CAMPEP_0171739536 /NCGR_PEP_ID=MMETSP0991-20121206/34309_1 /TAXON_ID=483369 /ORGANISM="non described non described, Strain CCMP2098" /LENGTH=225 /DNA_ID=CAMNT_0012337207 /DNA_START=55 /DNA_END=732 /DNA_ORIENTATION=+
MQRFLNKKEELPTATQSQGGNWGQGEGPKLPKVQTFTLITWAWFSVSIIMILVGGRYMSYSTDSRSLQCGPEVCTFKINGQGPDNEEVRFPRASLKNAESVRIRHKKIRDTSKMKKRDQRRLGYSYSITFVRDGSEAEETQLLSVNSIGRKRPTNMVKLIRKYLDDPEEHEVVVKEESGLDFRGLILLVLGFLSVMFSALLGQFTDEKPRRPGSQAKRVTKKRAY